MRSAFLDFDGCHGRMVIKERPEERDAHGNYNSVTLIQIQANDANDAVDLRVTPSSEEDDEPPNTICIGLSAYHKTNPVTQRTFHGNIEIYLSTRDAETLSQFLSFLVRASPFADDE